MKLRERIKNLPVKIQLRFFTPLADLHEQVTAAARVAATVGTDGWTELEIERDKIERALLLRFIDAEAPVTNWEQFVELRGYVRGFLLQRGLASDLIATGVKAEHAIEARGKS
jgi:hypothetical protein